MALVIVMLALQFGLYLHAAQVAEAAAQEAVEAAQAERAGPASGRAAARSLLSGLGGLRTPATNVRRTATTVTARVTGQAPQLIPGVDLAVSGSAEGPAERFIPETAR